jgi:hypothetical protein
MFTVDEEAVYCDLGVAGDGAELVAPEVHTGIVRVAEGDSRAALLAAAKGANLPPTLAHPANCWHLSDHNLSHPSPLSASRLDKHVGAATNTWVPQRTTPSYLPCQESSGKMLAVEQ